jgi:ATP-dependent Clp protease ATP-binding subunit ClpX
MDAHICDKCIEQAHGIVLEEIAEQTPIGVDSDLTLKKTFGN